MKKVLKDGPRENQLLCLEDVFMLLVQMARESHLREGTSLCYPMLCPLHFIAGILKIYHYNKHLEDYELVGWNATSSNTSLSCRVRWVPLYTPGKAQGGRAWHATVACSNPQSVTSEQSLYLQFLCGFFSISLGLLVKDKRVGVRHLLIVNRTARLWKRKERKRNVEV